jgi:hypothetical protein
MSPKDKRAIRAQSIEERIQNLREDIETIINAKVELVAKESPGVPVAVIRNLLTARAPTCACSQYLELAREPGDVREFVPAE